MNPSLLVHACVAFVCGAVIDQNAGGDYFEALRRDRESITSGEVELTVTFVKDTKYDGAFEGSVHAYHVWFDGPRYRVDLQETRTKEPEKSLAKRLSFSGETHRLIDLDKPDVCVREYSAEYTAGHPAAIPKSFVDLRLLGVVPTEYGHMHRSRLEELSLYATNATIRVEAGDPSGAERIVVKYPTGASRTYTTAKGSFLPVRMSKNFVKRQSAGKIGPELRIDVECSVEKMTNSQGRSFDFPRKVVNRRYQNDEMMDEEVVEIRSANFNVPIPPSIFEWKALAPRVGVRLIRDDVFFSPTLELWDGNSFASSVPGELTKATRNAKSISLAQPRVSPARIAGPMLVGSSMACAFVAVMLTIKKRMGRMLSR